MIIIRKEVEKDYDEIYKLVKQAFLSAEHSDGDEQDLVVRLRKSEDYVPDLSLVAEQDGKIVGHIMFTKIKLNNIIQLALAPVSVLPEKQKQGIGGKLINTGHRIAKKLGYEFSVLLGHASYYPKFGYVPASSFGIKCPFEVPEECFMALNLQNKDTVLNGMVEYSKAFFEK